MPSDAPSWAHEGPPEPFRCDVQPNGAAVAVVPAGELDVSTVPDLERELRALTSAGWARIVIDLRALSFIDSSGLHLLLRWAEHSRNDGLVLGIVPGQPSVQRIFEVSGAVHALPWWR